MLMEIVVLILVVTTVIVGERVNLLLIGVTGDFVAEVLIARRVAIVRVAKTAF